MLVAEAITRFASADRSRGSTAQHVLLKDFGTHVAEVSERLKAASVAEAGQLGRAVRHLFSSKTDKEQCGASWPTRALPAGW